MFFSLACVLFFKFLIFLFFFLDKKESKNQEKVIGQRATPDAAPLPFLASRRF